MVESFLALPMFIAGTDRLGLMQAGLADYARNAGGVRVFEPPFDATPIHNAMWWHPVHRRDPEHEWLRTPRRRGRERTRRRSRPSTRLRAGRRASDADG